MTAPSLVTIGDLDPILIDDVNDDLKFEIESQGTSLHTTLGQLKEILNFYNKDQVDAFNRYYNLPIIDTTGVVDLLGKQVYKLTAGASRTVSFTNIPVNKSTVAVIKVTGSGTINWPANIAWVNDAPVLGPSYTLVTCLFIDGVIIGNTLISA